MWQSRVYRKQDGLAARVCWTDKLAGICPKCNVEQKDRVHMWWWPTVQRLSCPPCGGHTKQTDSTNKEPRSCDLAWNTGRLVLFLWQGLLSWLVACFNFVSFFFQGHSKQDFLWGSGPQHSSVISCLMFTRVCILTSWTDAIFFLLCVELGFQTHLWKMLAFLFVCML